MCARSDRADPDEVDMLFPLFSLLSASLLRPSFFLFSFFFTLRVSVAVSNVPSVGECVRKAKEKEGSGLFTTKPPFHCHQKLFNLYIFQRLMLLRRTESVIPMPQALGCIFKFWNGSASLFFLPPGA